MKNKNFLTLALLALLAAALALGAKVAGLCNQTRGGLYCSQDKGHGGEHTFTRKAAK